MSDEHKIKIDLYEKLDEEYNNFIEKLKKKTPQEIIESSYEKVIKEELKEMFYPSNNQYDVSELKGLIKAKNSLDELYHGWMDCDLSLCEQLEYSVDETLELLNRELKSKNKTKER